MYFFMTVINFLATIINRKDENKIEQTRIKKLKLAVNIFLENKNWKQNMHLREDDINILQLNVAYIIKSAKSYTLIRQFEYVTLILNKIKVLDDENKRKKEINGLIEYIQKQINCIENKDIY